MQHDEMDNRNGPTGKTIFENGQRASTCDLRRTYDSRYQPDVTFKFITNPDSSLAVNKSIIGLHSKVFQAMFFGPLATTLTHILLEEEDADTFRILIDLIYGLEPQICAESVADVLHLAEKYWVTDATNRCVSYLTENLGIDTVCQTFELANMYCLDSLKNSCSAWINDRPDDFVYTDDFTELSRTSLKELLSVEEIRNDIPLLAHAFIRWGTANCLARETEPTIENIKLSLAGIFPEQHAQTVHETSCSKGIMASSGYISECTKLIPFLSNQCRSRVTHFNRDIFERKPFILDAQSVELELMADSPVNIAIAHFDTCISIDSIIVKRHPSRNNVMGDALGIKHTPSCKVLHVVKSWTSCDRCVIFQEPVHCEAFVMVTIVFRLRSNILYESVRIKQSRRVHVASIINFEKVPSSMVSLTITD